MARPYQTRVEPLQSLHELLPAMCESLSLARAHIVLDQVRSVLQSGAHERIVCVSAGDFANAGPPLAAAIGIRPPDSVDAESPIDAATIVHASALSPLGEGEQSELGEIISQQIDQAFLDHGVAFLQWSTDDIASGSHASIATWCHGLGFDRLATLDYLSGTIDEATQSKDSQVVGLRSDTLDWNRGDELNRFAAFVDQTYVETHDCPRLTEYRTALQTLRGYQASRAYAPDWWFRLADPHSGENLGCLILANHQRDHDDPNAGNGDDVAEIVYMGLVPSARGRGLGSEIVRLAKQIAGREGASRIILAVDQRNRPANSIYHRAGLQAVLSETVWVKSLSPSAVSPALPTST